MSQELDKVVSRLYERLSSAGGSRKSENEKEAFVPLGAGAAAPGPAAPPEAAGTARHADVPPSPPPPPAGEVGGGDLPLLQALYELVQQAVTEALERYSPRPETESDKTPSRRDTRELEQRLDTLEKRLAQLEEVVSAAAASSPMAAAGMSGQLGMPAVQGPLDHGSRVTALARTLRELRRS